MGTIADKLRAIRSGKAAIAAAIEAKGGTVPVRFAEYGDAVEALPSGMQWAEFAERELIAVDDDGVGAVGGLAFAGVRNLAAVRLANCTAVGASAFAGASELCVADLGGCASIGAGAFADCPRLREIFLRSASVVSLGANAFSGCSILQEIFVPAELHAAYLADPAWSSCGVTVSSLDAASRGVGSLVYCWSVVSPAADVTITRTNGTTAHLEGMYECDSHSSVSKVTVGTNGNGPVWISDDYKVKKVAPGETVEIEGCAYVVRAPQAA